MTLPSRRHAFAWSGAGLAVQGRAAAPRGFEFAVWSFESWQSAIRKPRFAMSAASKAVFLSYASQDAEAARRICDALRSAGVEVWFDQNELVGGDAWDAKIRKQIADCALFVPIISANTNARGEGYFRLEWKLAVDRSHLMAHDEPFLLPVAIDTTSEGAARVPPEFRRVQWTELPGDEAPEKFCPRIRELLAGTLETPSLRPAGREVATRRAMLPRSWSRPLAVAIGVAVAFVPFAVWQPWKKTAAPPLTEAQQLVVKAREIWEQGDEINRETYALTEELLLKAEKLDPAEASAWALHAIVSRYFHGLGFDTSPQRREAMRMQAERAAKLAPGTLDAELAMIALGTASEPAGAQQMLVDLAAKHPGNPRVAVALGLPMRGFFQDAKILETLKRHHELDPANLRLKSAIVNALYQLGRVPEAEELATTLLAGPPIGRVLLFDVHFKMWWRGDLAGATAAIERWPAWLWLEDRGVQRAGLVWHWRKDGARLLRLTSGFPREYVRDTLFTGPRSVLTAWAQELLARPELARSEWQNVVRVADQELSQNQNPGDGKALHWKAWGLARLGQTAEAEALLRLLEEEPKAVQSLALATGGLAGLQIVLGHFDRAFATLDANVRGSEPTPRKITKAELALNPVFDPIRQDPRFAALTEAAPGPEVRKEGAPNAKPALAVNDKSLVVLPLENLSPDPANAFFTDGMHFEITTTVSRLGDLKVISRDSALALKSAGGSLAEKAQKVGVANVITGSVRRAGTSVRVSLELRRARDEALLWSQTYDKELGEGVLVIQSDIADQVARVLQARERKGSYAVAGAFATNARAYDLFLQARRQYDTVRLRDSTIVATLEEVLRLEPSYMPAAALLSTAHSRLHGSFNQDAGTRGHHAAEAKRWAETAARLMPGGGGDGPLAVYYGRIVQDFPRALAHAENLIRALPNEATGYDFAAMALGKLGRYTEAVVVREHGLALDPLNSLYWQNQASALTHLRRTPEAFAALARYEKLLPPAQTGVWSGSIRYRLNGELRAEGSADRTTTTTLWRMRKFEELLVRLDRFLEGQSTDGPITDALRFVYLQQKSLTLQRLGQREKARLAAEAALALAHKPALDTDDAPDAQEIRRAQALALLGRADEAVATARRSVEAAAAPNQTLLRWEREYELAEIYATLNRPRECCELLAKLLRLPSGVTVPMLMVDPTWDHVREDPAFKTLLADPKNSGPL